MSRVSAKRSQISRPLWCLLIAVALAFTQPLSTRALSPVCAGVQGNTATGSRPEKIKAKLIWEGNLYEGPQQSPSFSLNIIYACSAGRRPGADSANAMVERNGACQV